MVQHPLFCCPNRHTSLLTLEPNCSPALVLEGLSLKNALPPWNFASGVFWPLGSVTAASPLPELELRGIAHSGRANTHLCLREWACAQVTHPTTVQQDTHAETQFHCLSAPVSWHIPLLQLPVGHKSGLASRGILAAKSLDYEKIRIGGIRKSLLLRWLATS